MMTFNVRNGKAKDGENRWELRKDLVCEVIRDYSPDVLGLQEAYRFQLDEFNAQLPEYAEVGIGRDGESRGEHSSILYLKTRFELLDSGTFWLSDTPDKPSASWGNRYRRICTWVRLTDKANAQSLYVYNTHMDHQSQQAREKGAALIMKRIAERKHADPFVLMGDFNAGEDNAVLAYLKGASELVQANPIPLVDSFRLVHPEEKVVGTGSRFSGYTDGAKIDHIFITPDAHAMDAGIVRTHQAGRYPSDHYPVTARIEFASKDPPTVQIEPGKKDNFSVASFALRMPKAAKEPRYVLVLLPGINGDGSGLINHGEWQKFAEETEGAIVACTFVKADRARNDKYSNYSAAQCGSGAALESAMAQFGEGNSKGSLKDLPLLIYGHSGGGQFAFGFSCHNPNRLIGFAAGKGGYYYPEPVEGTFKVPGLIISGQKDLRRRKDAIRELFKQGRSLGAPWCWMEDQHGHNAANNLDVVIPYFRELLRLQLGNEGQGYPDRSKLVGLSIDLMSQQILSKDASFDASAVNPKHGWLPSSSVFDLWASEDNGAQKYAKPKELLDAK